MTPALLAALLSSAWCALLRPQVEDRTREAPTSEGALDNDVFVPVSEPATRALSEGDQALERARAAAGERQANEAARLLDAACDRWHEALVLGSEGATTWFDLVPEAEHRLCEGVHAAVRRRLLGLTAAERTRWTQRFAPAARLALAAAGERPAGAERGARSIEVVRLFPLTGAAARAALELADMALEVGASARARGWIARAELEAELCSDGPLLAALAARRAALPPPPPPADEPWNCAVESSFVDSYVWEPAERRAVLPGGAALERWLRPGGVFVAERTFALQTAGEITLLSLAEGGELEPSDRLRVADLLGAHAPVLPFEAPREPPGWPLLPLADEHGLVAVVGRSQPGEPNALLALALAAPSPHRELGLELARSRPGGRLVWAIVGAERLDPAGATPVPALEELGDFEFQPGPVASGDLVVVQARRYDGQVRAWCLAFDRRDGTLAWKRLLAAGADRVATTRFSPVSRRVAAQPCLALEVDGEPRVFAGTHLGLGVLLDGLTGEPLWGFKNRRRGERDPGWSGDRPALAPQPRGAPNVLWAPMDSDRLYALLPRPLEALATETCVLARPPAPLFDAHMLLGGDADEHLVLGTMGKERTVSARRAGRDRIDALDLGQDERFRGLGLVGSKRVWVSTNSGLYLFDRTRELYLLDHDTLPAAGGEAPGGDLYARGAHVLVVGSGALWWFRAR